MTLQQLADVTSYSRGHLSKIERGANPPTMHLAQRCDAHFRAGGRLRKMYSAEVESAGSKSSPGPSRGARYGSGLPACRRLGRRRKERPRR
ncbi:helix-turn-helix domain-containing protein [Streptomyces sp. NPDC017940]|uniref:helix-turn-helix domain-containing protein n=1 Tax=Streptomyces sp. NPDC017940 TaxID=3365017 RepID=UPI003794E6D6